jgi:hypothetical protein
VAAQAQLRAQHRRRGEPREQQQTEREDRELEHDELDDHRSANRRK